MSFITIPSDPHYSPGPSLLSWIPKLFGKKVVSTCHGLDWQRKKWNKLAKACLKAGEKASILFPNKTTVVSPLLKDYFYKKYNKKTVYIANGISVTPQINDTTFLSEFGLTKNKYILFLSRIVPEKGLHRLIKAFLEIQTDTKLVIAGDHSHSKDYLTAIKKMAANDKRIIFTGPVFGTDKNALFSHAYCFVLPSDIEGMPLVLLEAMSLGCCPLVSDIPINKCIVTPDNNNHYGFTFKAGNVKSLKHNLDFVLSNPKIVSQIKNKIVAYVTAYYNWDIICDNYHSLYASLYKNQVSTLP